MKFSYNWLKNYLDLKLPIEKLVEILNLYAFETELLPKDKDILEIKVPTNRIDAYCHLGIAREISNILNLKLNEPQITYPKSQERIKNYLKVETQEKKLARRYSAALVFNIKVKESPKWLKERLISCGIRPINNIVDLTNYVMLETGQPLHAFDFNKLADFKNKKTIIVRLAKKGEKITTLENINYSLTGNELLISDFEKPLALAGIKGGIGSEIDNNTKNIVIEAANFEPLNIRETSKVLNLKTDASLRFENNLDPELTIFALKRFLTLLNEISQPPIKICKDFIDVYNLKEKPKVISVLPSKISKIAGFDFKKSEFEKYLKTVANKITIKNNNYLVEIKSFRRDLETVEDLSEELIRLKGLNNVVSSIPITSIKYPEVPKIVEFKLKIAEIFSRDFGFDEIASYSFIKEEDLTNWNLNKNNLIKLTTPASFGFNYLRPNLLIKILENISLNLKNFNEFKIFEIGKIFKKENNLPIETLYLAGAIVSKNQENNFLQLKGYVEKLFEIFNIQNFAFKNGTDERFEEFLKILINNKELGILGNISNNYQKIYDLKTKAAYFELNLEELVKHCVSLKLFVPLLKFPKVKRDLSIWMPQNLTFSRVKKIIKNSSKLLREIKLFDSIKIDNRKSYSFHLEFFDETRTLTEEEVEQEMAKIANNLNKLNIEIR